MKQLQFIHAERYCYRQLPFLLEQQAPRQVLWGITWSCPALPLTSMPDGILDFGHIRPASDIWRLTGASSSTSRVEFIVLKKLWRDDYPFMWNTDSWMFDGWASQKEIHLLELNASSEEAKFVNDTKMNIRMPDPIMHRIFWAKWDILHIYFSLHQQCKGYIAEFLD